MAKSPKSSNCDLVPDPEVARDFRVTLVTLWRWDRDPKLGFPPAVKIRTRKYRVRKELEEFKERMMALAIAERSKPRDGRRLRKAGGVA